MQYNRVAIAFFLLGIILWGGNFKKYHAGFENASGAVLVYII